VQPNVAVDNVSVSLVNRLTVLLPPDRVPNAPVVPLNVTVALPPALSPAVLISRQ
jgi:hypothetical protein